MGYLVKHYMRRDVPTIHAEASILEAARAMLISGRGFLIVLKEGKPSGIVTEHDFVEKVIAQDVDAKNKTVGEIMSSPLIIIDPDEDLLKASELMQKHNIRRIPVVKEGIIYGVITSRDIAQRVGEYVDRSIKDIMRWASPFGR
jgi:CBS domain-containing protein